MRYNIKYSNRKTLSVKVNRDLTVTVGAPHGVSREYIDGFVNKNEARIEQIRARLACKNESIANADTEALRRAAKQYIPPRVQYYANIMGVQYTGIKITSAKTRFGSCSAKNSLCFSLYLMAYPIDAVDAVIVHELAHIKEKNHSPRFYAVVQSTMPDYKTRIKVLKSGIL